MTFRVLDAIVDAVKSLRTTKEQELPVAAPDTNTSASISCVTQAKAFQDVSYKFQALLSFLSFSFIFVEHWE